MICKTGGGNGERQLNGWPHFLLQIADYIAAALQWLCLHPQWS